MSRTTTKDNVDARSIAYASWLSRSYLPRTLLEGTRGMREAGETLLYKNEFESEKSFENRLKRSTLLNAFRKTGSFLAGQVFQVDLIFSDDVPELYTDFCKKVDVKGNSVNVFAKRVFFNGLMKGVAHILIDSPNVGDENTLTIEEEQRRGIRPYFREIDPEAVIAVLVDENGFLFQVRILETKDKLVGAYGSERVDQIRVYNQDGSWELHTKVDGEYALESAGVLSIRKIPIVTFIPGEETTIMTADTPLLDLAYLNLHHWDSSSDQTNILHVGRVPILFGKHVDLSKMPVGVAAMVSSEEDAADLKYVEIQGAAIAAGAKDLKEREAQMALYGLQQLVPRSGNMTATEKAITSGESNSSLGTWATEFEDFMQAAFEIVGEFTNTPFPEDGISVNKEYNIGVANAEELTAILKANEQGVLSAQGAFTEFRRRGVFDEHLSWDDMEAEIEDGKRNDTNFATLAGAAFGAAGTEER